MPRTSFVSLVGLFCCLVASRASAQVPAVDSGSRIRVSLNSSRRAWQKGTVVALVSDTLRFVPERRADTIAVPIVSIRRLELRQRRSAAGGALVGGMWGMAAGGTTMLAIVAAGNCLSFNFDPFSPSPSSPTDCPSDRTAYAVMFGAAAAGAIIGSVVRGERWVRVQMPRVHASLAPSGIRIAIDF